MLTVFEEGMRHDSSSEHRHSLPVPTLDTDPYPDEVDFCRLVRWIRKVNGNSALSLDDNKVRAAVYCLFEDECSGKESLQLNKILLPSSPSVRRFYKLKDDDTPAVICLPKTAEGLLGDQWMSSAVLVDMWFTSNEAEGLESLPAN